MNPEDIRKLVDAYIERHTKQYQWDKDYVLQKNDLNFWAWEAFQDLIHEKPEDAWIVILSILSATTDEHTLGCLAAGQLEDLIDFHGELFIDRIEEQARRDPKFRELLCGVWQSSTPSVWARVVKAQGASSESGV